MIISIVSFSLSESRTVSKVTNDDLLRYGGAKASDALSPVFIQTGAVKTDVLLS